MTDIVERLRTDVLWHRRRGNETIAADCQEAADEIERLRAKLDQLGSLMNGLDVLFTTGKHSAAILAIAGVKQ